MDGVLTTEPHAHHCFYRFTCPGDGEPIYPNHHGWLHWFDKPIPNGGRPNTDLWPDLSEYSPSELYPAPGLQNKDGEQMFLFSSRQSKTVTRHFHWMALHGVDGAFLQRFAGQCDLEAGNAGIRNQRDEVGDRVREAAEAEGRVFAIMYVYLSNSVQLVLTARLGMTSQAFTQTRSNGCSSKTGCISCVINAS
jgi:hypothetical protein